MDIVIEIGGRYTKVGYSPETSPRFIVPTNLLPLDISIWLSSGTSIDKINNANNKIQKIPTSIQLKESLYTFFKSLFLNYLLCKADERKIIIVENLFLPRLFRESLVSVLFEQFRVPMIVFINPTASMIPTLRTTSLIIDIGYSETRVLPIYEGIGVLKSLETITLGSETLIRELKKTLLLDHNGILVNNENGSIINDQQLTIDTINNISESTFEDILTRCLQLSIIIKSSIRLHLIDRLYRSTTTQEDLNNEDQIQETFEEGNIASTILDCLVKCEHDQRKPLSHNILLLGGTTMIPGFKRKLVIELNKQIKDNKHYNDQVGGLIGHFDFVQHPFGNNYLAWLGGSILANTIEHIYSKITLDQYLAAPSLFKRNQLIPEWEKLSNINNYTQIAQTTIGTTINPLQFSTTSSLFSPFTSSSDLSSHLNKD
ncbi:hypothetical protein DICPUDRAFT_155548 [Dictyostelium purpureum]|uniref:Actin related protein 11 n=1 Tax=Dictyostelium purpureum TaxID=5786 RepID=F0ZUA7_DICPU|nr:uncharacterized protein DICPUDRAFT_155548 [Dictyostelium purpureum]EGC32474.1 hypothetical protein DICPUDRAFT_155548 [Dictyostelium purpureum]|eukprot:XP_003291008.1 hypothetical protein DICPUDRAFT_155548 [Dictyostelium purpureum]